MNCSRILYHRAYNTYLVLSIPGTSLWASATTTTAVRVYNNSSIYMTLFTEHFNCSIFGTTTIAVTTAAVIVVVVVVFVVVPAVLLLFLLCCSHITSSLQCSPRSQDRFQ